MFKFFNILGFIANLYLVIGYATNSIVLPKYLIVFWGVHASFICLVSFLKKVLEEKLAKRMQTQFDSIVKPIQSNINLTDEQKQIRIQEALKQHLENKLKSLQGEKNV